LIVEPFAGSASYAVRWHEGRDVMLLDVDAQVVELWAWLLGGCAPGPMQDVFRRLVLKSTTPDLFMTTGKVLRKLNKAKRLARAVRARSWSIRCADYREAPDVEATWFIDPPYQRSADQYRADALDYAELWRWCSTRKGQVILCEAADNDWIPEPVEVVTTIRHGRGRGGRPKDGPRVEVMWHRL
jgi:hypothetical protein